MPGAQDIPVQCSSFQLVTCVLCPIFTVIVLVLDLCWNLLEKFRLEDAQELPCNVQ